MEKDVLRYLKYAFNHAYDQFEATLDPERKGFWENEMHEIEFLIKETEPNWIPI